MPRVPRMASFIASDYSLCMKDLLPYLSGGLPQALEFLEQIVTSESPSSEKTLVDRCVRLIGPKFSAIGGQTGYVRAERFGDHLRVRFGGDSKGGVLLLGHTDTVWPGGEVQRRPDGVCVSQ